MTACESELEIDLAQIENRCGGQAAHALVSLRSVAYGWQQLGDEAKFRSVCHRIHRLATKARMTGSVNLQDIRQC